jgi:hypothetical protein
MLAICVVGSVGSLFMACNLGLDPFAIFWGFSCLGWAGIGLTWISELKRA